MNRAIVKQQWDRVLAIGAALVGVVLLVVGWVQVSSTAVVAEQIPYLASQCVGGLIAFGVATTLWISADLRDEWAKLDDIYQAVGGGEAVRSSRAAAFDGQEAGARDGASTHRREARVASRASMEESLT
jgi:hypothetical protein